MRAPFAIHLDPLRHGLDPLPWPHGGRHRGVDVGPRAGGNPAEDRRTERRALVDGHPLQRELEHARHDPEPLLAAGAPAGDPRELDGAAGELVDEIERVTQPEGHALEHGAHERSAVMAHAQAGECAASIRICVRRALAREVRREQQPLGSRRPLGGLGDERVVSDPGGDRVSQPAQAAGGREHHAHRVPRPRYGVAERVDARLGVGGELLERGEHDARGSEHDRQRPGAINSDPERAGRLIAGPRGNRDTVAGVAPDTSGLSITVGSQAGSSPSASRTSSLQRRPATSSNNVPDASATSIACAPHRRRRT